jgi:nucleoside-diphosphate-sugar epimerase
VRVLITGGAGFIGSHLVERFLQRGSEVRVLDNLETGRRANLVPFLSDIDFLQASILDPSDCRRACEGVDCVLHQAAVPSVPRSIAEPGMSHASNLTGTLNMLIAARDSGVSRFVSASSSSTYGDSIVLPKEEDASPSPKSPYAVAKLAGEHYCRVFSEVYDLETVSLRYFNVFGPRQDPESPYAAMVPRFVTAALNGVSPTIFSDGEQTRDFTYISNVVDANLNACGDDLTLCGEAVNVGGGQQVTVNEGWGLSRDHLGASAIPQYADARPGDVRHSLASLRRAKEVLNYTPTVSVQDGIRIVCDWYRDKHREKE